jgi:hypothetical protein
MSKLLLKRDDQSESHPHPDQVDVGELVINSVTGKLYSKLIDGSIVEWFSQKVCFDTVPTIRFSYGSVAIIDSLDTFCCAGDMFAVEILELKIAPKEYSFEFTELTDNTSNDKIVLSSPQYSTYPSAANSEILLRKALVPIKLSITKPNNISIFKFTVLSEGRKLVEKLLTIRCYEQACSSSLVSLES